jgi:hypothetical protein
MHKEWVRMLLVVGLMTGFGLAAATISRLDPSSAPETVMMSLAGGIILGAVVGVAIIFSRKPTYATPKWREPVTTPRRPPKLAGTSRAVLSATVPPSPAPPESRPAPGSEQTPEGKPLDEKRAAAL